MKTTRLTTDGRIPRLGRRPRAPEPAARWWEAPQTKANGQPPSLRQWILVADDERPLRILFSRVLTEAGYAVVAARHGVEALELAREVFPHLIILDLRMPRMSGIEVLAHVQQIPVIILSGYLGDLPPELAARPNVVALLEKPVTLDVLRSTVRAALQHSTGETESARSRATE